MIETAKKAAKEGGRVILKYFGRSLDFTKKKDESFVSVADREAEEAIKKVIASKYPEHAINGEETGATGKGRIVWHIDPIDGTSNFKSCIKYCCTSVGIEKDGKFIIGVIYNPFSEEMFYAESGKGAFLNGKRIKCSSIPAKDGINILELDFRGEKSKNKPALIEEMMKASSRFRMYGSAALELAEVARGSAVSMIADKVKAYDFAAGIVIAAEAGACATDCAGNKITSLSTTIAAANSAENHSRIIKAVSRFYN